MTGLISRITMWAGQGLPSPAGHMFPRVHPPFAIVVTAVLCAVCAGIPQPCRGQTRPQQLVEEWLRGPDRRDFPWKVRLLSPRLTFQQRYLVQVRANIPVDTLQRGAPHRDLHFLVRVADDQGHWFPGEDYNHYAVPPNLDSQVEIQFTTGLYLRRGEYVIAVIAYDSVLHHANVWRRALRVAGLKHDPLPQLDRDLPPVEFLSDVPRDSVAERARPMNDDAWALGHGREWLPVRNRRPLQVDVVLNFSDWIDPQWRGAPSAFLYRQRVGRILQIGSVLSHLQVENGCVRLSGLDLNRLRLIFDQAEASQFNWDTAQGTVASIDQNTIDVSTVQERTQAALLFRNFLSRILFHSAACGPSRDQPRRVVIIAGGSYLFSEGTKLSGAWPEMPCDCQFYYLRADTGLFDDIERLLKAAQPRQFRVATARDFRKALAQIIADLERPWQP